ASAAASAWSYGGVKAGGSAIVIRTRSSVERDARPHLERLPRQRRSARAARVLARDGRARVRRRAGCRLPAGASAVGVLAARGVERDAGRQRCRAEAAALERHAGEV